MIRRSLIAAAIGAILPRTSAAAHDTTWIVDAIYHAADRYGVSGDWLLSTARCESQLNPDAYNPRTGDCGLFQFNPDTWRQWGGGDIWSVYDQCDLAAWAFSRGLHTHWCCSGTWQGGPCQ